MPRVALSYRRDDSAGSARLIFERLVQRYGQASVFMDIDAIELGEDFRERIDRALRETSCLLVLIGPRWLGPLPGGETRIMEPNDPVRMEVELAFELGIRIVPVLLDQTKMPNASALPPSLEKLTYLNAADVTSGREFDSQMERIIRFLERTGGDAEARPAQPDAVTKPRHNLPRFLTDVIGREHEVAEVAALLRAAHLVTIVGSGGIGKTRVAVQVAGDAVDAFADGVWFVDLSALDDPLLVPGAIAVVLDVVDRGDARPLIDSVAATLKTRSSLIVFDNCEHVLAGVSDAARILLQACPGLRVLSTSREPLGVTGEESYRMPSLQVPPPGEPMTAERVLQYPAVALFVARARAVQRRFVVTDEIASIVADIVRRLDGIALAIELAAPRVKVLTVQQLDERLNDRFKLLTGGRTGHSRQQTLRAMIGWSYDLLNPAEKSLLRQCAIFRGGWTLEAAEAVCTDERCAEWDVLDLLASLVDKSLVVVEIAGDEQRYDVLESTRQFALEKLAEAGQRAEVAARHGRYYAAVERRVRETFLQTDQEYWDASARRELENYRAAIDWGLGEEGDALIAASIAASLPYLRISLREGLAQIARAAAALPGDAPAVVRGRLVFAQALFEPAAGKQIVAATTAVELLSNGPDDLVRVEALGVLGVALARVGRGAEAISILEECVAASRGRMPRLAARSLRALAANVALAGDGTRARLLNDEAAALLQKSGNRLGLASLQMNRAEAFFADGDDGEALASAREAEAVFRELGDERELATVLLNLSAYRLALGRLNEAWSNAHEALPVVLHAEESILTAVAVEHLAQVAAETGDPERAARLLGYADAVYRELGYVREPTERRGYEHALELIRAALPEDRIASLLAAGEAMDQEAAVAAALAIPQPGTPHATQTAG